VRTLISPRAATATALLLALGGCGDINVQPDATLPKALIAPQPARVGLVLTRAMQNFTHKEDRYGIDWVVRLGPGHARLWRDALRAEFREVRELADPGSLASASLQASFEPRIEQYSFATARETGGAYFAVTIRYRIMLYAGDGRLADSFTLTGYGNARAEGMSNDKPLVAASLAAMRDAAAKFLVQFPEQDVAKTLARGEPVVADAVKVAGAGVTPEIEAVPIEESAEGLPAPAPSG
jgi:hypothetical protein